jgi:PhnB protein
MSGAVRTITPMLSYEDAGAAADWLVRAFGFEEAFRYTEESGKVSHVELRLGDGGIMLGTPPDYVNPKRLRDECEAARAWHSSAFVIDGVHVYVEDVDAHCARAREAGATILSEVEDTPFGDRHYRVEDPEGHRWMIATHVREVAPEEWGAEVTAER